MPKEGPSFNEARPLIWPQGEGWGLPTLNLDVELGHRVEGLARELLDG